MIIYIYIYHIYHSDSGVENMGDEIQRGVVYCGEIQWDTLQYFVM